MARDIIIQVRLPRWSARRWLAVIAVAFTVGAGAVYAKVNWTPFVGGAKLTSQQLNDNFKAMGDAIDTVTGMIPPPTLLPHLILDQGNVDLGVYLGTYSNDVVVFSAKVKAPLVVFRRLTSLYFDGANCTGNAYIISGPASLMDFSNTAINSDVGTILQVAGPMQKGVAVRSYMSNGMCVPNMNFNDVYPLTDTKVPNVVGGTVSIQMK